MFERSENLKDSQKNSFKDTSMPASYSPTSGRGHSGSFMLSYSKVDKLVTALYMVTDIIDTAEPLRHKLRTSGVEIISDINLIQNNHIGHPSSLNACSRISEIMSFLAIASDLNIISEMNSTILRKEFSALDRSIKELIGNVRTFDHKVDISELFKDEASSRFTVLKGHTHQDNGQVISKGHNRTTRIGVQKGSTLMKALSDRTQHLSDRSSRNIDAFNTLKKQRREEIVNCIKDNNGNATITDIKGKAIGSLATCGEKTLQRELVSMVKDGVLNKTGEKRWSRYFIRG